MGAAGGKSGLRRRLGLGALAAYGTGAMLGAAAYAAVGPAAGAAGSSLWLSYAIAAAVALVAGLSYAELCALAPDSAAEVAWMRAAWPRLRGLRVATGAALWIAGAATAAIVASTFGGYLAAWLPVPRVPAAIALLCTCTALILLGTRSLARVVGVFTLVQVLGLLGVVMLGAERGHFGAPLFQPPHAGVLAGAALVFFPFLGFTEIANLASEARDPSRNLPAAILLSFLASTTLFVLAALALVALADPDVLATGRAPLAMAVAERAPAAAPWLGAFALVATANAALISLLAGGRMLWGMGRGGEAPAVCGRVWGKGTPRVAVLAALVAAAALVPFAGTAVVANVASLGALLAFVVVNCAVVVLRVREPRRTRPFAVPWCLGPVPVLPLVGATAALALAFRVPFGVWVVGGAALVAVVTVWSLGTVARRQA